MIFGRPIMIPALRDLPPNMTQILLALIGAAWFWELLRIIVSKIWQMLPWVKRKTTTDQIMDAIQQISESQATMKAEISELRNDLDQEKKEAHEREAENSRSRLIRFDDELRLNMNHSKGMFDAIMVDCDRYEEYCERHEHFHNGVATSAIDHIRDTYRKCMDENSFL